MQKFFISFSDKVNIKKRKRIKYAFKVYCATRGYVVSNEYSESGINISYGYKENNKHRNWIFVPERYQDSFNQIPSNSITHKYMDEKIVLFFGLDENLNIPDYFGEIFEWISSAREIIVDSKDGIGRIDESELIFQKDKISPKKPYASIMMYWLDRYIEQKIQNLILPENEKKHYIVCTHDIDFYNIGKNRFKSGIIRTIKNIFIGLVHHKKLKFSLENFLLLIKNIFIKEVGCFFNELLKRAKKYNFSSSLYVITESKDRKDANYNFDELIHELKKIYDEKYIRIGLHGSYNSSLNTNQLKKEKIKLSRFFPNIYGGRQHYLRFNNYEILCDNIELAGMKYDSTFGFSKEIGFRHGASFAFPPYDFKKEAAYNFLEFPLVIMDTALMKSDSNYHELVEEVLNQSRKWSNGGIAVLWHNPLEPLNCLNEINDIFWSEIKLKDSRNEKWLSGEEYYDLVKSNYSKANLL